jgi:hypothetical protein
MLEVTEDQGISLSLLGVLALEPFHPARGIDKLLLSSKERMALRTDFEMNFGLRRPRPECFSAGALDDGVDVIRMNVGFH